MTRLFRRKVLDKKKKEKRRWILSMILYSYRKGEEDYLTTIQFRADSDSEALSMALRLLKRSVGRTKTHENYCAVLHPRDPRKGRKHVSPNETYRLRNQYGSSRLLSKVEDPKKCFAKGYTSKEFQRFMR